MRNLVEYPVTAEEVIETLKQNPYQLQDVVGRLKV